jgi:hypothetical protein
MERNIREEHQEQNPEQYQGCQHQHADEQAREAQMHVVQSHQDGFRRGGKEPSNTETMASPTSQYQMIT